MTMSLCVQGLSRCSTDSIVEAASVLHTQRIDTRNTNYTQLRLIVIRTPADTDQLIV